LLTGKGEINKQYTSVNEPEGVFKLRIDRIKSNQFIPFYNLEAIADDGMYPLFKGVDIVAYKKIETHINSILFGDIYMCDSSSYCLSIV